METETMIRNRTLVRLSVILGLLVCPALGQSTVRTSVLGTTEGNGASQEPSSSFDALIRAFSSTATDLMSAGTDTNGSKDILVQNNVSGVVTRVSVHTSGAESNNNSYEPKISGNGLFVVFTSDATNLVTGDANGLADVF